MVNRESFLVRVFTNQPRQHGFFAVVGVNTNNGTVGKLSHSAGCLLKTYYS